VLTCCL
jgi:transposase